MGDGDRPIPIPGRRQIYEKAFELEREVRGLRSRLADGEKELEKVLAGNLRASDEICLLRSEKAALERDLEVLRDVRDTLRSSLEARDSDFAKVEKENAELRKGKPLGPIIGANTIVEQEAELKRLREVEKGAASAEEKKDAAYAERNRLVALLASQWPACLSRNRDQKEAADGWNWVVFVGLPTGQASWHIHDRELSLFGHVPKRECPWDGHSDSEKYARVKRAYRAKLEDAPCCPHPDAYTGGSHYHCGKCGEVCGMMGHHHASGSQSCKSQKE